MFRFIAHYTFKVFPHLSLLVRSCIVPPNSINIYHQTFPSCFNSNLYTNQQGATNSKDLDPMSAANRSSELVYNKDGFISDITQEILHTEIAKTLGIKYLSNATGRNGLYSPRSAHRYIHGVGVRFIVSFLVFLEGPPLWIFSMFDTGAPRTFITAQVWFPPYIRKLEASILKDIGWQSYWISTGSPRAWHHFKCWRVPNSSLHLTGWLPVLKYKSTRNRLPPLQSRLCRQRLF